MNTVKLRKSLEWDFFFISIVACTPRRIKWDPCMQNCNLRKIASLTSPQSLRLQYPLVDNMWLILKALLDHTWIDLYLLNCNYDCPFVREVIMIWFDWLIVLKLVTWYICRLAVYPAFKYWTYQSSLFRMRIKNSRQSKSLWKVANYIYTYICAMGS